MKIESNLLCRGVRAAFEDGTVRFGKLYYSEAQGRYVLHQYFGDEIFFADSEVRDVAVFEDADMDRMYRLTKKMEELFCDSFTLHDFLSVAYSEHLSVRFLSETIASLDDAHDEGEWRHIAAEYADNVMKNRVKKIGASV